MEKESAQVEYLIRQAQPRRYCTDCYWLRGDFFILQPDACGHPHARVLMPGPHKQTRQLSLAERNSHNDCPDWQRIEGVYRPGEAINQILTLLGLIGLMIVMIWSWTR